MEENLLLRKKPLPEFTNYFLIFRSNVKLLFCLLALETIWHVSLDGALRVTMTHISLSC